MKPDLDAIRARCEAATPGPWAIERYSSPHDGFLIQYRAHKGETETVADIPLTSDAELIVAARTDIPALLAYIDELERDLLNERATFESCNRARMHCEYECATLKDRTTHTTGETEVAHRIATLEHMLAEERENVDTLRASVAHAEQRFVDEYDARKAAEREIAELKARITTLEAMR